MRREDKEYIKDWKGKEANERIELKKGIGEREWDEAKEIKIRSLKDKGIKKEKGY